MNNIKNELDKYIISFKQLPYLFIGAGLSMRYSNSLSWNQLLENIWRVMNGNDSNKYKKYVKAIAYDLKIDNMNLTEDERKYKLNPKIATKLQEQFNYKFYHEDNFDNLIFNEEELNSILENDYDPFKFYISKQTKDLKIDYEKEESEEIKHIVDIQNKIAGVITTNYDYILEKELFTDFETIIGQDNLLTANTGNIFEIYKIHGSASNPDSIVITEKDYEDFKNKLKYLSAKLLTIFVEHPIIFIGYGIGDVNIRSILEEIAQCLNKEQLNNIKDNFIFLSPVFDGDDEGIVSKEIEFINNKIIMTEIKLKDYSILFDALAQIKASMPVKIIRKLQDMICNFIISTEANNNIIVGNINNPDINGGELGVYIGELKKVSSIGFDSYDIDEIIEDILFDNRPYLVNSELVTKTFKRIRSRAGKTYIPVYKYIKKLNIQIETLPKELNIIYEELIDTLLTTTDRKYVKNSCAYKTIKEIEEAFPGHLPKQFAHILKNIRNFTAEELRQFIIKIYNNVGLREKHYSVLKKLVALYDYFEYSK